jgi:hypothetical protein
MYKHIWAESVCACLPACLPIPGFHPSRAQGQPDQFPLPGTAPDFFTDMHRVLRYASLGPVKSFCHHRCVENNDVRQ